MEPKNSTNNDNNHDNNDPKDNPDIYKSERFPWWGILLICVGIVIATLVVIVIFKAVTAKMAASKAKTSQDKKPLFNE